jgi:hypothetical protein
MLLLLLLLLGLMLLLMLLELLLLSFFYFHHQGLDPVFLTFSPPSIGRALALKGTVQGRFKGGQKLYQSIGLPLSYQRLVLDFNFIWPPS